MEPFLHGLIAMGFAVSGLFFFRFWRETGDLLFLCFGIAFFVLAVDRFFVATVTSGAESYHLYYLIRLLGFCLFLAGIVAKNIAGSSASGSGKDASRTYGPG